MRVHQPTIPKTCPTTKLGIPTKVEEKNPEWDGKGGGLGPLLPRNVPSPHPLEIRKDWRCPLCNNVNFCGRVHCNKCRAIIPDGYEAIHGFEAVCRE